MLKPSQHLLRRMARRGISKKDIQFCLQNYHTDYPGDEHCWQYVATHTNGRLLKVVVDKSQSKIVTAVWLD